MLLFQWEGEAEQRQEHRQREAGEADDHVPAAEEVVLASQHAGGRQHQRLLPAEAVRVVVVLQSHGELVGVEVHLDPPVQLPERWQRRGSHPDDQVLLPAQRYSWVKCAPTNQSPILKIPRKHLLPKNVLPFAPP